MLRQQRDVHQTNLEIGTVNQNSARLLIVAKNDLMLRSRKRNLIMPSARGELHFQKRVQLRASDAPRSQLIPPRGAIKLKEEDFVIGPRRSQRKRTRRV